MTVRFRMAPIRGTDLRAEFMRALRAGDWLELMDGSAAEVMESGGASVRVQVCSTDGTVGLEWWPREHWQLWVLGAVRLERTGQDRVRCPICAELAPVRPIEPICRLRRRLRSQPGRRLASVEIGEHGDCPGAGWVIDAEKRDG